MFTNTAYEALYQVIGLELHARFIELITGESFFKGLVLLIFGAMFFVSVLKFVSRYVPGSLIERRSVPLSRFLKITAYLFLGLTILRVGTTQSVQDYKGQNWSENRYIREHHQGADRQYRVSIVFDLLSRTAEEVTGLLSKVIDDLFAKGNSQLSAPNFFYKAIMYSGASSIDDPELKSTLGFYTEECFSKVLPAIEADSAQTALDRLFRPSRQTDDELEAIALDLGNGKKSTCLTVKNEVRERLITYASSKGEGLRESLSEKYFGHLISHDAYWNNTASMHLVNYYLDQKESAVLGIQRGSETPGATGAVFHNLNRLFSWDGLLSMFGQKDLQGAAEVAKRSQEFSEHLARAPHVAGFIKMLLIAGFPWLMFFVVAGKWRVLLVWFWIYFSVLMWTPLWTLLYHIMLGIALSSEVMKAFGELNDGISLYSAALVNSRMYYMFSIYAWAQLLVASLTTGAVFVFLKPMLGERHSEESPEFIDDAKSAASTGASLASGIK